MAAHVSGKSNYVGQTQKLLRNGYGTYRYENQFFQYEGEWVNGKKHGHGRLVMKDGTFYEGMFVNGEIEGNGYKYFATSGSKYKGHFERGELHGYGIMQYKDGTMFDGQWENNKKQGYGVLKTNNNSTYKGEFVGSLKHGDGFMLYENGDQYSGDWIMDKRQGHGHLICIDGTEYEGQWLDDRFHGEGLMKHSSGVIYEGQWINGYPVALTTRLSIIADIDPLEIIQGQTFSVKVECHNDLDELIVDQGRELHVSAGFRFYPMKEGSALFDMIEDVEEKPVETPFGYSIVPYPLTCQACQFAELEKEDEGSEVKAAPEAKVFGREGEEVEGEAADEEREISRPTSPVQESSHLTENISDLMVGQPRGTTPLPVTLSSQRTEDGQCQWEGLQLAPPPPMYRPFLAMEEEAAVKKSKSRKFYSSKDKSADKLVKKESREKTSLLSLVDEKFARPGEYVVMVQDITTPPFFSKVIEPAFLLIKLKKPKPVRRREKESKPKWDTQKFIQDAMQRS